MPNRIDERRQYVKAADIVRDAGGEVVGRTRLQKIAYLLELAGLGVGFKFEYRHYGPYSEELAHAIRVANLFGELHEVERVASWGGFYSVFTTDTASEVGSQPSRVLLATKAAKADPVALELAATAAFLALEGSFDPWEETATRKPEKAVGGQLEKAKRLYESLRIINTPCTLPAII